MTDLPAARRGFCDGRLSSRVDRWRRIFSEDPHQTEYFFQGYGDTAIDQDALAYYRYAWAVQDMVADGEQVFFSPDLSDESRRRALRGFRQLFDPGKIVSIAEGTHIG